MGTQRISSRPLKGPYDLGQVLGDEYNDVCSDRTEKPPPDGTLEELYDYSHGLEPEEALTGLCISGGGIRSATLGLGVLQALAAKRLLGQFDYMSTVSGGGYIGSWLKAWQKNNAESFEHCLEHCEPEGPATPEPAPVRHLRSYSSYLSPKLGLLSGDTWTLAAIYLRNLLLNWFILIPVLVAAILLPWIGTGLLERLRNNAVLAHWSMGVAFLTGAAGLSGVVYLLPSLQPAGTPDRRSRTWVALIYILPLLLSVIGITFAWYHFARGGWMEIPVWLAAQLDFEIPSAAWPWMREALLMGAGFLFHALGWGLGSIGGLIRRTPFRPKLLAGSAVGGLVSGLLLSGFDLAWVRSHHEDPAAYLTFAVPAMILIELAAGTVLVGIYSSPRPTDVTDRFEEDREWWGRSGGVFLIVAVAWIAFVGVVLYVPQWFLAVKNGWGGWMAGLGVTGSGLVTALVAWWAQPPSKSVGGTSKVSLWLQEASEKLLGPLFLLGIVAGLSLSIGLVLAGGVVADPAAFDSLLKHSPLYALAAACVALLGLGYCAGLFVSANRFSLQSMYRNRLIRAYLGAARERKPDLFTGFDPGDNLLMADLPATRPFHIVNMALNVTGGTNLAWQQRKATSFTATRMHCGSAVLGDGKGAFWKSEAYTDAGGLSLGTAVAISGAAASPNMGYHTSEILTLILSLFNVRLGMWLPNPAEENADLVRRADPAFPYMIVTEALGMADEKHPWVYLSDGGHFENLGLYELVRRRCRYIVVSDGGADPKYEFEDLSNAIQKIRVDLGVPITRDGELRMAREGMDLRHCGLLTVHYDAVDGREARPGRILYFKAVMTGDEETDVRHYAGLNPQFPQEPTSDQFFNETQFESYRKLGQHAVESALAGFTGGTVGEAIRHAETRYLSLGERGATA